MKDVKTMLEKIKENVCKKSLQYLFGVLAAGILLMGLVFTYSVYVKKNAEKPKKVITVESQVEPVKMKNGEECIQSFVVKEKLNSFSLRLKINDEKIDAKDKIIVELLDKNEKNVINTWIIRQKDIENEHVSFSLSDEKKELTGKFYIRLKFEGKKRDSNIGIYSSNESLYNAGKLQIENKVQSGDMAFTVYAGNNRFLYGAFGGLVVILCMGGVFLIFLLKKQVKLEKIALFLILFLGTIHSLVMPAYSTPDERAHIATTYYYSNILLGEKATDAQENVLVRNEDLLLNVENMHPTLGTYALINDHFTAKCQDDTMVSMGRSYLSVPFWSYAPQIIMLSLARIMNLGNILTFFLVDVGALLFYAVCVYLAIKYIPFGKMTMMVTATLAMSLEMACSFSYDVVVNSLSLLFIGYVFYLAYDKKEATIRDWIYLIGIMAFMAPIKVVYVMLSFLCILIPKNKERKAYLWPAITIISSFFLCIILRLSAVIRISGGDSYYGETTETFTISYILTHISTSIGVLYNTLREMVDPILEPLFGQRLGVWDINIPFWISFCTVILLLLSVLIKEDEKKLIQNWQKSLMFLISICLIGLITLSLMLDFTPINAKMVMGIQGRYFIPFLPIMVFCLRNSTIVLKKSIDKYLIVGIYFLNYLTIWRIFETVVAR